MNTFVCVYVSNIFAFFPLIPLLCNIRCIDFISYYLIKYYEFYITVFKVQDIKEKNNIIQKLYLLSEEVRVFSVVGRIVTC